MAQKIMVVDDDRLNRELLSKVLRQEGYQFSSHAMET